jgi:hypothetical protein
LSFQAGVPLSSHIYYLLVAVSNCCNSWHTTDILPLVL